MLFQCGALDSLPSFNYWPALGRPHKHMKDGVRWESGKLLLHQVKQPLLAC
jgi:hypothetical protein